MLKSRNLGSRFPDGNPVRSRIEGSTLLFTPDKPGAYALVLESAPPLAWVAVNVLPDESDVRAYDSVAEVEAEIRPELFQKHVDLSPFALGLGFVLLVLSSLMAVRGSS